MLKKQFLAIICLIAVAIGAAALLTGCLRSPGGIVSVGNLMSIGVVTFGNAGAPVTAGNFVSAGNYVLTSAGNVVFTTAGNATPGNANYDGMGYPTPTPAAGGRLATAGTAQRANAISTAAVNALGGIEKLLGKADCKTVIDDNGGMTIRFAYQDVEYRFIAQNGGNEEAIIGEEKTWATKQDMQLGERGYLLCVDKDEGVAYMMDRATAVEYVITAGKGVSEASLTEVANAVFPQK